jgi:hypothetical protein
LEEGRQLEVVQTIRDPNQIMETGYKHDRSARDEIPLVFRTANVLLQQEISGGIDLLVENAIKYNTQIKNLVPIKDKIAATFNRLERTGRIQIRNIGPTMQTRMTILVL